MKTQQAPAFVQSARVEPTQLACKNAQFSNGGISSHINHMQPIVSRLLLQLENRFFRTHTIARLELWLAGREG
ncbi:Uncharacterised protein [Shigella sonnei]|nr:Uncharacterised protein [Shigella sonnei]CSP99977.1 Uncharacterised protein [Shigella sonnei]